LSQLAPNIRLAKTVKKRCEHGHNGEDHQAQNEQVFHHSLTLFTFERAKRVQDRLAHERLPAGSVRIHPALDLGDPLLVPEHHGCDRNRATHDQSYDRHQQTT
jgi:hypothetical protein